MDSKTTAHLKKLQVFFSTCENALIAFSGGVDSTFLLYSAYKFLGNKAAAVTVKSALVPEKDFSETEDFCRRYNIKHFILEYDPFSMDAFKTNPKNRCYFCKKEIFSGIKKFAQSNGFTTILEGSNLDDTKDYRPGMLALQELDIVSPLKECGLTKQMIRDLCRQEGLDVWDKPSAACLASRVAQGEAVTPEKISRIAAAEKYLHESGFKIVRCRTKNNCAKIELGHDQIQKGFSMKNEIISRIKEIGFSDCTIDPEGYKMGGSM